MFLTGYGFVAARHSKIRHRDRGKFVLRVVFPPGGGQIGGPLFPRNSLVSRRQTCFAQGINKSAL
jgi:hypothetical protein